MTYYVRKLHYVTQSLIPVAWIIAIIWIVVKRGTDPELFWVVVGMPIVLSTILIYGLAKQSKVPIVETTKDGIRVNNIFFGPQSAPWSLATGLKKYPLLGYKLNTIGRSVWLPIGMLARCDAERLLREVREHLEGKT